MTSKGMVLDYSVLAAENAEKIVDLVKAECRTTGKSPKFMLAKLDTRTLATMVVSLHSLLKEERIRRASEAKSNSIINLGGTQPT